MVFSKDKYVYILCKNFRRNHNHPTAFRPFVWLYFITNINIYSNYDTRKKHCNYLMTPLWKFGRHNTLICRLAENSLFMFEHGGCEVAEGVKSPPSTPWGSKGATPGKFWISCLIGCLKHHFLHSEMERSWCTLRWRHRDALWDGDIVMHFHLQTLINIYQVWTKLNLFLNFQEQKGRLTDWLLRQPLPPGAHNVIGTILFSRCPELQNELLLPEETLNMKKSTLPRTNKSHVYKSINDRMIIHNPQVALSLIMSKNP